METLFRAYFLEAEDIGSADVLSRAAADCGIHMPEPQEGAAEVRALVEQSRARGIAGVPAFFRGGVWIASGAQPPEMLAGSLAGGSASGLVRM